ncbi:MAG: hypothetical protein Q8P79_02055 [Nanoarchaeota archaeon]|nr:hypothetical protein [Nanoarchaeota archaeon]
MGILDLDDPEVRRRLEETVAKVQEELRPLTDSIRASRHLTAADYNIRINSPPLNLPKDYDFSQLFIDY